MSLSALVASSANTKTAEARSSSPSVLDGSVARAAAAQTSLATPQATATVNDDPTPPSRVALDPSSEVITPPPADLRLENPKLRRMQKAEITPPLLALAATLVRKHHAKPVGTQVELDIEGKHVIARLERHFHPEGGPVKPWGFHPGVSLFVAR